MIDPP